MLLYWSLLPVSLRLCSMEWIYGKPWSINRAKFYLRSLSFQFLTRVTPLQRFERVCIYVFMYVRNIIFLFFFKGDQWARPGGGGGGGGGEGGVKGRGPGG